jgi:ADP-ribose pyrophosphatase YjhB (NUDIX family)
MPVKVTRGERVGKRGRIAVGCSAAVVDPATRKILLVRRADNLRWAVPGGYMDPGESVTEACAREVLEETGVHVSLGRLIAIYASPHVLLEYPDGNRWQLVLLYFAAEPIGGTLNAGDETTEAGYFSRAEAEKMDMSRLNRQRIADAFAPGVDVFIREDMHL